MSAPQAPLAPPPPMAALNEDQSNATSGLDAPPLQTVENKLNGADVLAGSSDNAPPDQYWEDDTPPIENEVAAKDVAAETDSKPKKYDFFGHVHELAYSANAEKSGLDLKAMEQAMVDKNLLPAFAIQETFTPPPLFAFNVGQRQMETSLNHYRDKYFALKAQA